MCTRQEGKLNVDYDLQYILQKLLCARLGTVTYRLCNGYRFSYRTSVLGFCPLALHWAQLVDAKGVNGYQNFSSKKAEIGKEMYVEGVREHSLERTIRA